MASPEDFETLVGRIRQGDRQAFFRLYALTSPRLFGLCKTILDDDDWAAEVLEAVYEALWQDSLLAGFGGLTSLTWLIESARSAAVAARQSLTAGDEADPIEIARLVPSRQMRGDGHQLPALRKALSWLPEDRRDAILLSYFTGLRYSDLATRNRVPHATMRNWQRRSLDRIYQDLTGRSASEDALLAGEFVLGVLPRQEIAAFEERLNNEDELRQLLVNWTEDFVVLTDSLPDASPPGFVREHLDQTLFAEQSKSLLRRMRVGQGLMVAALSAGVLWMAQEYWPQMKPAVTALKAETSQVQTNVRALASQPDPGAIGPDGAHLDPVSGIIRINGTYPELEDQDNLAVYLDFGANSEWISLGDWPIMPPVQMQIPLELTRIALSAQVVVLGGPGADRELLRLPLN